MAEEKKSGLGRRGFLQASALGTAAVVGGGIGFAPSAAASGSPKQGRVQAAGAAPGWQTSSPAGKVPLIEADMRNTYVNPINLPNLEVRSVNSTMAATDANVANAASMLAVLAKPQWVEADGRGLVRSSKTGFAVLSENAFRTAADFSPLNVDGTIYLYASGGLGNAVNSRTAWSTTDYLTWTTHEMNIGLTAPTVIQVGGKFYMAGNSTPFYIADSPVGPWTEFGRPKLPNGTQISAGDTQFFLDTDGRLFMNYNIGAPILGVELDPQDPRKVLSEAPVVLWDFNGLEEWQHFGDNKQSSAFGYVEGGQMFKVGDTYYMSVAVGGTEHTTYCTGVMSAKSPLGPFKEAADQVNPIGYGPQTNYPSALFPNAGHGAFVVDKDKNLMFFYSYVIAYEQGFERRLGIDKCEVSASGAITCRLSNTPRLAPGKEIAGKDDVGLYNLSTLTSAYWASSYAPGRTPYYAGDRSLSTWWQPADSDTAPSYIMGFANPYYISAAQIQWKEIGYGFTKANAVRYTLEYRDIDSNSWKPLVDRSTNTVPYTADYTTFDRVFTHAVRLKILGTTENAKVGVAQLNVFGENYTLAVQKGMIVPPPAQKFVDVPLSHPRATEINWMYTAGLSTGTPQPSGMPKFGPAVFVDRQAYAAFLYRAAGNGWTPDAGKQTFADVSPTHPFYNAIEWVAEKGISLGTTRPAGKPLFKPAAVVNRQDTVLFLWRLANKPTGAPASSFTDVARPSDYATAIDWATSKGITTGYTPTLFKPTAGVDRQSAAVFLYRYFHLTNG